jgi:hypothetical protein
MKLLRDSVRWEDDSEWCVGKNFEAGIVTFCEVVSKNFLGVNDEYFTDVRKQVRQDYVFSCFLGEGGMWLLNATVSSSEYSVE